MIGVFDSGVGGLAAVCELRRLSPAAEICFFADRENAPYGTKSVAELCRLVSRDIDVLRQYGADRVLMACCTASTVWHLLPEAQKRVAFPILAPAARRAAKETRCLRVAVLATEATVTSRAFAKEIARTDRRVRTYEIAAQPLVALAEEKLHTGRLPDGADRLLDGFAAQIRATGADRLILGCTHFSHLQSELASRLPDVGLIGAAAEGARAMLGITADPRQPLYNKYNVV